MIRNIGIAIAVCGALLGGMVQSARVVVDTEAPTEVNNAFILDFGNNYDSYSLQFGENLDSAIEFDKINNLFKVNRDFDFTNHQAKNIRIDNQSTAPACNTAVMGKIYFNTTSQKSFICDGVKWDILNRTKKYDGYRLEQIDQTDGTVSYILRIRITDNKWLITKSNTAGFAYAQTENNTGFLNAASAWTSRLTLNYIASFVP